MRDFVVWGTSNSKKGKSVKKTIISPFLKVYGSNSYQIKIFILSKFDKSFNHIPHKMEK